MQKIILILLLLSSQEAVGASFDDNECFSNNESYKVLQDRIVIQLCSGKVDDVENAKEGNILLVVSKLAKRNSISILVSGGQSLDKEFSFSKNESLDSMSLTGKYKTKFTSYVQNQFISYTHKIIHSPGGMYVYTYAELTHTKLSNLNKSLPAIKELFDAEEEIEKHFSLALDVRLQSPLQEANILENYLKRLNDVKENINQEFKVEVTILINKIQNELTKVEPYHILSRGLNILIINTTNFNGFGMHFRDILLKNSTIKINQVNVSTNLWRQGQHEQSVIATRSSLLPIVSKHRNDFNLQNPAVKSEPLSDNTDVIIYLGALDAEYLNKSENNSENIQDIKFPCFFYRENNKSKITLDKGDIVTVLGEHKEDYLRVRYKFVIGFIHKDCTQDIVVFSTTIKEKKLFQAWFADNKELWTVLDINTKVIEIGEEDEKFIRVRKALSREEYLIKREDLK